MSSPKGWPTQHKLQRTEGQHVTVNPLNKQRIGLDVLAHSFARVVASDAAEADSTEYVINATSHSAVKGDIIRFSSGTHSGREVVVYSADSNSITLCETLESAVAESVTFDILRHTTPSVTADGEVKISGTIEVEPAAGAATEAKQDTQITHLAAIETAVEAVQTAVEGTLTVDLPSGASTAANQTTIIGHLDGVEGLLTTIDADTGALAGAVSGSEMQVDVVGALPAGSNNIGDVDVASVAGRSCVALATLDYSSSNVGTGAYVELKSDIGAAAVNEVEIFDSSGEVLILAVGATTSEVDTVYILPGGNGRIPLQIPANSRLSLKALSTTVSSGIIAVNLYS